MILPSSSSARSPTPEGRLFRSWRAGQAKHAGVLEDYADVANGLYELHVATGELRWLEESRRLALLAVELFHDDERGGFFLTPSDGEQLVSRKKDFDDNPTPSGNSMLAYVLLRLARLWGEPELERQAVGVFRFVARLLPQAPSAFGHASERARSVLLAAAGDRHHRSARIGVARAALAPFDAEHSRRLRPERGGAAARGARTSSTGARRSTSARTSPVRRR